MFRLTVVLVVLALSQALPFSYTPTKSDDDDKSEEPVELRDYRVVNDYRGHYKYEYSLTDGTEVESEGDLVEKNGVKVPSIEGFYTWIDEDGNKWVVTYKADDKGTHVKYELEQSVSLPGGVVASLLG